MHFGKSNNFNKVSKPESPSGRYFFKDDTNQKDKTCKKKGHNSKPATQVLSCIEGGDTNSSYEQKLYISVCSCICEAVNGLVTSYVRDVSWKLSFMNIYDI